MAELSMEPAIYSLVLNTAIDDLHRRHSSSLAEHVMRGEVEQGLNFNIKLKLHRTLDLQTAHF
jgi:hypothetical protein